MCAKFHFPSSAVTLFSEDGENGGGGGGGFHSFSVTESQKSSANPGGTTVYD